jgi:hypothetical protein
MGAYKYLEEVWRKKQSDVLRFLLRIRFEKRMFVLALYGLIFFLCVSEPGNIARPRRSSK